MMKFCGKVLLFGEYAIIYGSSALAIPFSTFDGYISLNKTEESTLFSFIEYALNQHFVATFNSMLLVHEKENGIRFDSTIPQGFGLGSSGALCAAFYQRYFEAKNLNLHEIKRDLVTLESFFHGTSSGIDPMVSYLKSALLVKGNEIYKIEAFTSLYKVLLVDSGKERHTEHLMKHFRQRVTSDNELKEEFLLQTDRTLTAFFEENSTFWEELPKLINLQKRILPEWYAPATIFKKINDKYFGNLHIKMAGAGGGGFYLAFCNPTYYDEIIADFNQQNITTYALFLDKP